MSWSPRGRLAWTQPSTMDACWLASLGSGGRRHTCTFVQCRWRRGVRILRTPS
ncbi:hypothetical protein ATSB10_01940 [Dyella thiooxydans]|uniref:Uncharacterized protein n=1 Tax=Dyella thiooxydans TaxID=445710 RepID=A0A160MY11_9GAMM|nr:hypothetical protein ATSB10_01940 [Dyella thiooxydans]